MESPKKSRDAGWWVKRGSIACGVLLVVLSYVPRLLSGMLVAALKPTPASAGAPPSVAVPPDPKDAPVTPAPALSPNGKWHSSFGVSEFDDAESVTLSLLAERPVSGWPGKTTTSALVIRCKERRTAMFVHTGMAPQPEYGKFGSVTVRVRLDDWQAQNNIADESTDKNALFLPETIPFIRDLMESHKMVFGFTPFNSTPVVTEFELDGLKEAIKPVRKACRW